MNFGEHIKRSRENRGLSLREVARRSEISHPYLSQLESGKNKNPTPQVIKKISKGLDEPYMHLMNIAGHTDYVYDSIAEFTGLKPSQIEQSKKGKVFASGSEYKIKEVYLDNLLIDDDLSVYYKGKAITKEERESINQLIDIHLKR